MVAVVPLFPRTFLLKVKKWQDRKRKIELGNYFICVSFEVKVNTEYILTFHNTLTCMKR
jgi:uncharacterized protein (DUF1919 family)